jgi:hypothetical protein
MNSLIIGSGFGLYGYLPSVINFSKKIYLNYKYQKKFLSRKNLKKYLKKIIWYKDINYITDKIDYVVIAQKPKNQYSIIKNLLKYLKPKLFFLEKPISNNPSISLDLIKFLEKNKIRFSTGFLFKYLDWYKFINKNLSQKQEFKINWQIKVNKNNNLWKYNRSEGGGLTRFYAIHFIRLLFDLKIFRINKKNITKNRWNVNLSDKRMNSFDINLTYSKINKFEFYLNKKKFFKSSNPFLKKISKYNDPRVKIINNYLKNNIKRYNTKYDYEKNFLLFWKKLER